MSSAGDRFIFLHLSIGRRPKLPGPLRAGVTADGRLRTGTATVYGVGPTARVAAAAAARPASTLGPCPGNSESEPNGHLICS